MKPPSREPARSKAPDPLEAGLAKNLLGSAGDVQSGAERDPRRGRQR